MQVSIKRQHEMADELKRMHQAERDHLDHSGGSELFEAKLAHLEAEKDHLHTVLKEKNRESSELANRLQETGQMLQMRSKQLDELATEIQEARKAKERSEMTQG